ncbi:hypothetical protein SNEBB_010211, partial [Seison nebaliae]
MTEEIIRKLQNYSRTFLVRRHFLATIKNESNPSSFPKSIDRFILIYFLGKKLKEKKELGEINIKMGIVCSQLISANEKKPKEFLEIFEETKPWLFQQIIEDIMEWIFVETVMTNERSGDIMKVFCYFNSIMALPSNRLTETFLTLFYKNDFLKIFQIPLIQLYDDIKQTTNENKNDSIKFIRSTSQLAIINFKLMSEMKIIEKSLELIMNVRDLLDLLEKKTLKELDNILSIIGNYFQWINIDINLNEIILWNYSIIFHRLISNIYGRKGNEGITRDWHPILGRCCISDIESLSHKRIRKNRWLTNNVIDQLRLIWSPRVLEGLFLNLKKGIRIDMEEKFVIAHQSNMKKMLKRFSKSFQKNSETETFLITINNRLNEIDELINIRQFLQLTLFYRQLSLTFTNFTSEIYTSFGINFSISECLLQILSVISVEKFIELIIQLVDKKKMNDEVKDVELKNVDKYFYEKLSIDDIEGDECFIQLFIFVNQLIIHQLIMLDDKELMEQFISPLRLRDLSNYLNELLYRLYSDYGHRSKAFFRNSLLHQMILIMSECLRLLHERNIRCEFIGKSENFWSRKQLTFNSQILNELTKNQIFSSASPKLTSQKLVTKKTAIHHDVQLAMHIFHLFPFAIPRETRLKLFRNRLVYDKRSWPVESEMLTIRRDYILEDSLNLLGSQLATDRNSLRKNIHIRFVSGLNYDEIGIDQHGLFKEYMEELFRLVLNPNYHLFQITSEQFLYPSVTSYMQQDHLKIFYFIGAMMAKAVYEGIVLEFKLAPFFLRHLLGAFHTAYSFIDDLPSYDKEIYNSLIQIKHYESNVRDLDLTFSVQTMELGQLNTHDLITNGEYEVVTNENRVLYIHLVAQYHMYTRIREQIKSFVAGFHSLIPENWLKGFSITDIMSLIGGENDDFEVADLQKHTQYFGGYHAKHEVIKWFWDIVQNDFSSKDRQLLLKFVTSSSKPPFLGFSQMKPPFSIGFSVSDNNDNSHETIGNIMKTFFNLRKRDTSGRLPTSATCFNLLNLPLYTSKSMMKERLRYAINSNCGFELL